MSNKEKGRFAEALASQFLKSKGYKILYRNWTCSWGEIDLLGLDKDCLVFVEVKYRTSNMFGYPEEALTMKKKLHLVRTFNIFLDNNPKYANNWRFDVLCIRRLSGSISGQEKRFKIAHYKSVELV